MCRLYNHSFGRFSFFGRVYPPWTVWFWQTPRFKQQRMQTGERMSSQMVQSQGASSGTKKSDFLILVYHQSSLTCYNALKQDLFFSSRLHCLHSFPNTFDESLRKSSKNYSQWRLAKIHLRFCEKRRFKIVDALQDTFLLPQTTNESRKQMHFIDAAPSLHARKFTKSTKRVHYSADNTLREKKNKPK